MENFKKVNELLHRLNMRLSFVSDNENTIYYPVNKKFSKIVYNQFRLSEILFNDKEVSKLRKDICSFALHEIGHFIITPKQRRRRKDYGIPDNKNGRNFKYSLEEVKATMIENELRRLFGFSYKKNLYDGSNVDSWFIPDNKKQIMHWWNTEGKILAKTYAELV